MHYVKIFYDALKAENYREEVSNILIGTTCYVGEDKLEIVNYIYKSFCKASMYFYEDEKKDDYCTMVKKRLYMFREKEKRKREKIENKKKLIEEAKLESQGKLVFLINYRK